MARDLQVSVPLLGQIMSAMLGLSVVLGLIIGPLSDRSGYRLLILVGLVAATICLFVFGLSPTFLLLLLASAAGAVTDAGVLGSSLAVAGTAFDRGGSAAGDRMDLGRASRLRRYRCTRILAAIGTVAGWRVAFIVAGFVALAVVVTGKILVAPGSSPAHGTVTTRQPSWRLIVPLLRDSVMRRLYGATMVGAVCWYGVVTYLGAFLVEALGLGTGHVGLVYMAAGTGYCWAVWPLVVPSLASPPGR